MFAAAGHGNKQAATSNTANHRRIDRSSSNAP
jgi:hypothetical protein